jgi:hypothetical protein
MPEETNGWRGRIEANVKALEENSEDVQRRLRSIERTVNIAIGGLAVLNLLGIWKLFTITGKVGP